MREVDDGHRAGFEAAYPGWIRLDSLAVAGGAPLAPPDGADADDTIARLALPAPLAPGQTIDLDVRWTAQLPRVFARTGFAGDYFMVGQWYPKLAVYDRGRWDSQPWHANAEFFHDFGSYDLALTVPSDYVTGASGVRVGETDHGDGTKTVTYRAERVTDVAWTASPDLRVVTRDLNLDGRPIQLELLLPPEDVGAVERHLAAASLALESFSRWYGPYPWPKLTVVAPPSDASGADGMEYPMLVTTAPTGQASYGLGTGVLGPELLTVHEIAHQWFPMQVQSNEAAEPFLDESLAEYASSRVLDRRFGDDRSLIDLPFVRIGSLAEHRSAFVTTAARLPVDRPAWEYSSTEYTAAIYAKGPLVLLAFERSLGDERFTSALRVYADRWRWRHPTIADFQAALEDSTGERLDGLFGAVVRGREVVEYRVAALEPDRAVVERVGEARIPVDVRLRLADGTARSERWDGQARRLELDGGGTPIDAVALDPDERLPVELNRLDDARVARVDPASPPGATPGR